MTGLARRLNDIDEVTDYEGLADAYDSLVADDDFLAAVERATADEESVRTRLGKATEAFSDID
jgi:hypothetical protein